MLKTISACLALACLLIAAIAGTASANRIQLRPGGEIALASLGKVTFHASTSDIHCAMTLRGRLLGEAVENTSGTRIGEVDEVQFSESECEPVMEALSLPWPMRLTASYTGTRVAFTITGFSVNMQGFTGGLECLYTGNENAAIAVSSGITGLVTSAQNALSNTNSIFCWAEVRLVGTFSLEPHQTVSTI